MPTTGVINTANLIFYVGATPVAITCQTDASLTVTNATRSTSCKGSGQWTEALYGQTTWEGSGTALASYDGTFNISELLALAIARTVSPVVFGTGVSGDDKMSGSVIWTSMAISSAGLNENVTIQYSFTGTGALTLAPYA